MFVMGVVRRVVVVTVVVVVVKECCSVHNGECGDG